MVTLSAAVKSEQRVPSDQAESPRSVITPSGRTHKQDLLEGEMNKLGVEWGGRGVEWGGRGNQLRGNQLRGNQLRGNQLR